MQALQFKGEVRRESGPGAAGVTLLGALKEPDGSTTPAQLSLSPRSPVSLPATLSDATIELSAGQPALLRAGTQQWSIECRTWQLHRDVGTAFYAAIVPRPTPWTRRLSWRVLLGIAATAPGRWLLSRRSRVS